MEAELQDGFSLISKVRSDGQPDQSAHSLQPAESDTIEYHIPDVGELNTPAFEPSSASVLERPFTVLSDEFNGWIAAHKARADVAVKLTEAFTNPQLSQPQQLLVDQALSRSTESEKALQSINDQRLRGGDAGSDLFNSERAILIGRAYIYARMADKHPHLLSELISKLTPGQEPKLPPAVIRERVLAFYKELAEEENSLMVTLVSREWEGTNDTPVTCYLRGMIEPYFKFCRIDEQAGVMRRLFGRFGSTKVPEQYLDLRDDPTELDARTQAFLDTFYSERVDQAPKRAYAGQILKGLARILESGSDSFSKVMEIRRILSDSPSMSDTDLYYLIENLPKGGEYKDLNAHESLIELTNTRLRKNWAGGKMENLDVAILWQALSAVKPSLISDLKEFSEILGVIQRVVEHSLGDSYRSEYTRDVFAIFKQQHRAIFEQAKNLPRMKV